MNGGEDTDGSPTYDSGDNSASDNAFSNFSGIANNAWNTGAGSNSQAATNIAANSSMAFDDDD
jgi:hypothetical protein